MSNVKCQIFLISLLLLPFQANAKIKTEFGDSTKNHVFTLKAELLTRGEYIKGAVPDTSQHFAAFVLERTRLSINYQMPHLEIQITPQHIGVWGTSGGGGFNLREAWAKADYKGAFLQVGRQSLTYDDERVVGLDDWSWTGAYHDALKLGYEGFGHKVHLIGAYAQNNSATTGGSYYINGDQVYKNMEALWYHYDFKRWFSGSLLFINTGMQSLITNEKNKTYYQQLVGTYWRFHYPQNSNHKSQISNQKSSWFLDIDASFYYQFGRSEYRLPISAWMAAVEGKAQINKWAQINAGYFHLSGDENYTVPPPGGFGMQQHKHDHSFNLLFASHHQFYGAMDFFYLQSFYGGYSPGFQDAHIGGTFLYNDIFNFKAQYHALATTVDVISAPSRLLGHQLEMTATYDPFDWLSVSASYTFMQGTRTMEIVKRASDRNQSHWVYLMLVFKPTLLKVRF